MKYEKPDLEELDIVLEGSFLGTGSTTKDPTTEGGKDDGDHDGNEDEWG